MNVYVAKSSGFCRGVKNAVQTALSVDPKNTYVLGEIIHNPDVVNQLNQRGIITVDSLDEVPSGSTVIFRSHGVPKNYYDVCTERKVKVIDCTCPFVRNIQLKVQERKSLGDEIIIIGEPTHPEVIGIQGWCDNCATVIKDENCDFLQIKDKNVSVVCQTTFSLEKFEKIIKNIKKLCEKTVAVFKTICYTTIERQKEAENLSKSCDCMVVIGGLNSSNTNKLFDICSKNCENVIRLSNAFEFDVSQIKKYKNVGIVSGASTPNAQTREVLLKMENNTQAKEINEMDKVLEKIDAESKFKKGQIVKASIAKVTDDGLEILLPFSKKEIPLSKDDLDCEEFVAAEYEAQIGETIELMVVALKPNLKLSQKMIRVLKEEEAKIQEIADGKEFVVECTGSNKGGLTANLGTYPVFVPAKEIKLGFVKDLTKYVGKNLRLVALEVKTEGKRKQIIASQRVILQKEKDARDAAKAAKEKEFFDAISVGDVVEGKVERATSFGAFVSVNGFDCLAHISDLSWTGASQVNDVLEIGKMYDFKILNIDVDKKKVSIGYKQLQPQPWDLVEEKYNVGDVVHGKVVRIVPFGAFVEIEKGVDGLVHVSQIAYERIETPATVLNVGDEVDAKIVALDIEAKKMNLSIKATLPAPEKKAKPEAPANEEAPKKVRAKKEDEELSNWSEGSISVGTSLADLLANAENNK